MNRNPAKASPAPKMTMRRALSDPALLGKALEGDSWQAWRVLLIAMMGEPLTEDEREDFKALTGRNSEPLERVEEFWGVIGMTCAAVIADEAAFWFSEADGSLNPDSEILDAVRPGLATTHGPLIVISSPYARRGEVYETWKRHYGAEGDPKIVVARVAISIRACRRP